MVTWGRGWVGVLGMVGVGGWNVGPAETVGGAGGEVGKVLVYQPFGGWHVHWCEFRDVLPEPSTFTKY